MWCDVSYVWREASRGTCGARGRERTASLRPEGHHGINPSSPPRRDQTSRHADEDKEGRHREQRAWVPRRDPEDEAVKGLGERHRERETKRGPANCQQ